MKLYVDDLRDAPGSDYTLVRTINDAIRILSTMDVSELSLDHDNGAGECYCPIAYYVAEKFRDAAPDRIPKIIIHSSNPVGAKEMQTILKRDGGLDSTYIPMPTAHETH